MMMLVVAVLQLMRLRMVEMMTAEEVRSGRWNVVALAVLLARRKLRVDDDRGCCEMMLKTRLLMLLMITTGRIHQEGTHPVFKSGETLTDLQLSEYDRGRLFIDATR